VELTSWIEERYAVEGLLLSLKEEPKLVWTVASVGSSASKRWVSDRQKAHERWRGVTDV